MKALKVLTGIQEQENGKLLTKVAELRRQYQEGRSNGKIKDDGWYDERGKWRHGTDRKFFKQASEEISGAFEKEVEEIIKLPSQHYIEYLQTLSDNINFLFSETENPKYSHFEKYYLVRLYEVKKRIDLFLSKAKEEQEEQEKLKQEKLKIEEQHNKQKEEEAEQTKLKAEEQRRKQEEETRKEEAKEELKRKQRQEQEARERQERERQESSWYEEMKLLNKKAEIKEELWSNESYLRKEVIKNWSAFYRQTERVIQEMAEFLNRPDFSRIQKEFPKVVWYSVDLQKKILKTVYSVMKVRDPFVEAAEALQRNVLRLKLEVAAKATSKIPIDPSDLLSMVAGVESETKQIMDKISTLKEEPEGEEDKQAVQIIGEE
jgi:hypothetical protein